MFAGPSSKWLKYFFQDELYAATKRFVIMKDMRVGMAPCGPNDDYEDSVMTVKYVQM